MERRRDVLPPLTAGKGPRLPVLSPQVKIRPRSSLPPLCSPGSGRDAALPPPPWRSIVLPGPGVRSVPPLCRYPGGSVAGSWCRALGLHRPRALPWGGEGRRERLACVLPPCLGTLPPASAMLAAWPGARRGASLPPKARRGRAQLAAETCPVCSHQRPAARAAAKTAGALLQPCGWRWVSGGEGRAAFFPALAPPVVYAHRTPPLGASFSLFPSP